MEPSALLGGDFNFNVINPELNELGFRKFVLSDQLQSQLDDILEEIMEKVNSWETRMETFFKANLIISDSWRIRPGRESGTSQRTLFQSKSGETHRAIETLATLWHRMLFASDPYFEGRAFGLDPMNIPIKESQIYAAEAVLLKQNEAARYKDKVLTWLRSLAGFGTGIAEEPYVSLPYGFKRKHIEFTDFINRSLLLTGFDVSTFDIYDSDFIFTIDFVSKWVLRNLAAQDTEHWDMGKVEQHVKEWGKGAPAVRTRAYGRLENTRRRAGYFDYSANVYENLNYHGRIETNSVVEAFAESIGMKDDPKYSDWTVGILDGHDISKFHMTQYGDWRTRFKVSTYKKFETESLGYGVGQLGRKLQRNLDLLESLTDDKLLFDVLNMMKIGKYSGYDQKQFVAEPLKMVELEDISQLAPLVGDPRVLQQALVMINLRREDFRNVVGAQTNLQAQITKASATESAIAQTEAIRAAGVHAEIIAESLRDHSNISHVNNLNYMDEPVWVTLTGMDKPVLIYRNMLPINVGFIWKIVTDKNFRPERQRNLLQGIQIATSIQQFSPTSIKAIDPMWKEYFRDLGMNPRILEREMTAEEMLAMKMMMMNRAGAVRNQMEGEQAGDQSPERSSESLQQTPVGLVPTSPLPPSMEPEVSAT